MTRHKDVVWGLNEHPGIDGAALGVLMDLRDELKAIRRLMECHNVQAGFIAMQNTAKVVRRPDRRLATKLPLAK